MTVTRWLSSIGMVVGIGCALVAQRSAVVLKGFAVGERLDRLHAEETEVSWLQAQVAGLASPARLAQAAAERRLQLVAWSSLLEPSSPARSTQVRGPGGPGMKPGNGASGFRRLAAAGTR